MFRAKPNRLTDTENKPVVPSVKGEGQDRGMGLRDINYYV